jgi:hypothetical protein
MSRRIGIDPKCFATTRQRGGAEFEHRGLGELEVVDPDIEMSVLRPLTIRPRRRSVVGNAREGDARPIGRVTDHHPIALVLHPPHAEQRFVERGQCIRILAINHNAVQSSDHGRQCGIAEAVSMARPEPPAL